MNDHIRTDTSPEREAHLRVLAGTDNAMRDAIALLDAARAQTDAARAETRRFEHAAMRLRDAMGSIAHQALREFNTWWAEPAECAIERLPVMDASAMRDLLSALSSDRTELERSVERNLKLGRARGMLYRILFAKKDGTLVLDPTEAEIQRVLDETKDGA
jgi:hypothetical protein